MVSSVKNDRIFFMLIPLCLIAEWGIRITKFEPEIENQGFCRLLFRILCLRPAYRQALLIDRRGRQAQLRSAIGLRAGLAAQTCLGRRLFLQSAQG